MACVDDMVVMSEANSGALGNAYDAFSATFKEECFNWTMCSEAYSSSLDSEGFNALTKVFEANFSSIIRSNPTLVSHKNACNDAATLLVHGIVWLQASQYTIN